MSESSFCPDFVKEKKMKELKSLKILRKAKKSKKKNSLILLQCPNYGIKIKEEYKSIENDTEKV